MEYIMWVVAVVMMGFFCGVAYMLWDISRMLMEWRKERMKRHEKEK